MESDDLPSLEYDDLAPLGLDAATLKALEEELPPLDMSDLADFGLDAATLEPIDLSDLAPLELDAAILKPLQEDELEPLELQGLIELCTSDAVLGRGDAATQGRGRRKRRDYRRKL